MKKLFIYFLFLLPLVSFGQLSPWKICQYQGTATGQDTYSVTIGGENMNQLTPFIMQEIAVTYTATNTGASTLKVNRMSAYGITLNGSELSAGDIVANQPVKMMFDIIASKWCLMNGSGGGGGTVTSVNAGTGLLLAGTASVNPTLSLISPIPIANGGTNTTTSSGTGSVVLQNTPTLATPIINGVVWLSHNGVAISYAAASNTNVSRGQALETAFSASVAGDIITATQGTYSITSTLLLKDSLHVQLEGAIILNYSSTGNIFTSLNVSGWSIKSNGGTLIGIGPNTGGSVSTDEHGIYMNTTSGYVSDWTVEGLTIKNFKGSGIFSDANSGITYYDKGGSVYNNFIINNNYGIYINAPAPGGGPDYNIIHNNHIHNNNRGIDISSGNCNVIDNIITNNNTGIYLRDGYNHSHGLIMGNDVNHNQVYGLYCYHIKNGETIMGNHFLENYSGSIVLDDCNGVNIIGGQIHAQSPAYGIIMTGAFTGKNNYLRNIWTNTNSGVSDALTFSATADQLTHLIITDCSTDLVSNATCNNGITLAGDITTDAMTTTTTYTATLAASGVVASTYGDYKSSPNLTIDSKGRVINAVSSYISELNYPSTIQLATGGAITTSGGYTIHTFTSNGTFIPAINLNVEYLVVAGGGAGGSYYGGGGGAGGLLTGTTTVTPSTYSITIGSGGTSEIQNSGASGSLSAFSTYTATGGGGGGNSTGSTYAAKNGGSGGGAGGGSSSTVVGTGVGGQGHNGGLGNTGTSPYSTGGGGGATSVGASSSGSTSGAGGAGTASSISGSSVTYGGGGGGGSTTQGASAGTGGSGGGGAGGGSTGAANGTNGTANTGGGGGGAGNGNGGNAIGGNGGSGIVIIRYLTASSNRNNLTIDTTFNYSNSSGTKLLRIETNGNTGIGTGTTTVTQKLQVNGGTEIDGKLTLNATQTSVNASTSGTVKFCQSIDGTPFKLVSISCAAALGTASYTFPTAFAVTPSVVASNDIAAGVVTSLSTTAVTITGATSTGSIMLIGY